MHTPEILCQMQYSGNRQELALIAVVMGRQMRLTEPNKHGTVFLDVSGAEPPISDDPMPSGAFKAVTKLGPGVRGFSYRQPVNVYAMRGRNRGQRLLRKGEVIIPFLIAEKQGSGHVGRFLTRLSRNCVIVSVISKRLEGMLIRRGYKKTMIGEDDYWRR
jgi:hypothetical protein